VIPLDLRGMIVDEPPGFLYDEADWEWICRTSRGK
jgi:hypothetical protein